MGHWVVRTTAYESGGRGTRFYTKAQQGRAEMSNNYLGVLNNYYVAQDAYVSLQPKKYRLKKAVSSEY